MTNALIQAAGGAVSCHPAIGAADVSSPSMQDRILTHRRAFHALERTITKWDVIDPEKLEPADLAWRAASVRRADERETALFEAMIDHQPTTMEEARVRFRHMEAVDALQRVDEDCLLRLFRSFG